MNSPAVRYLVFDTETAADGELVARTRYPGEEISGTDAIARYRDELLKKYDSDFIPYSFQLPVSVAIAKVSEDFRLLDLAVLDAPAFRPHVMTDLFWRGWEHYQRPTWVSFNGRSFDLPVMELAAFRYGLSIPGWFSQGARSYEQPRNRYNQDAHIDLQDVLTNFGTTRFTGGLNLAANLLGKPGKMDIMGYMVQDLYNSGKLQEINDYCRCDVLDTYFVFLRSRVLVGQMDLPTEQERVRETKAWVEARAENDKAYQLYLERWGDWVNPWEGK